METDEVLVTRCQQSGDESAFAELVRRHRDRVFRLALSILGRRFVGDAEEVTQEVFLRAHHSLPTFRGEATFGSWLYRITFNLSVNLKERVRYHAPHLSDESMVHLASADPGPHDQLNTLRRSEALAECIGELPEIYQSALRLNYWMETPTVAAR